mmetsp:Transcript_47756/g.134860  ORF Transcript_47756/g.134860 Transcript_47756/m.134860 type:complete len:287 (-) Transcript_47756:50-910(-)
MPQLGAQPRAGDDALQNLPARGLHRRRPADLPLPVQGLDRVHPPRLPATLDPRALEPLGQHRRELLLPAPGMRAVQGGLPRVRPRPARALPPRGGAPDGAALHRAGEHGARHPGPPRHLPRREGPEARPRARERRAHRRRVDLPLPRHGPLPPRVLRPGGQQLEVRDAGRDEEASHAGAGIQHLDPDGPYSARTVRAAGHRLPGLGAPLPAARQQRAGRARPAALAPHSGEHQGGRGPAHGRRGQLEGRGRRWRRHVGANRRQQPARRGDLNAFFDGAAPETVQML